MKLVYIIIYFFGMIGQIVIRYPYQENARKGEKREARVSLTENILLSLMTVVGLVIPLIYALTHWLDFANYQLPNLAGWCGIVLLLLSLFIFWRSHTDLKANWSPSLEIRENHTLVTNGIYGFVRHGMYASQLVMAIAQALLLQNWLAGPLNLLFFVPFFCLRSRAEEQMMIDHFGDEYRRYMDKVGGVFPKFSRERIRKPE